MEFNWGVRSHSAKGKVEKAKNRNKSKHYQRESSDDSDEERRPTPTKTPNPPMPPIPSNSCGGSEGIYSNGNDIYFYAGVTNSTIITLQKKIQSVVDGIKTNTKIARDNGLEVTISPIKLHIFSPGGSVFACFALIDFLTQVKRKNPEIKFHSIVEGRAASAGTLMSVICDKRYITEYGYMLIHQLSSVTWGKYNEMKDDIANCDILMDRIKAIYKKHAKVPDSEIDEILKHDLYWDAEKCLKYGLVDEIIS
jgi:ATP-dependent protease ClpP protease subunit